MTIVGFHVKHKWTYFQIYYDSSDISFWSSQCIYYRFCEECGAAQKSSSPDRIDSGWKPARFKEVKDLFYDNQKLDNIFITKQVSYSDRIKLAFP